MQTAAHEDRTGLLLRPGPGSQDPLEIIYTKLHGSHQPGWTEIPLQQPWE